MADLPTPSISGSFNTANNAVSGSVTWGSQANLEDLDQVRVRYVRRTTSSVRRTPSASTVRGLAQNTGGWSNFTSGGNTFQYRDDVVTSGFDNTPPSFTDRTVQYSESSLAGYYCWGMSRLEV